MRAAGHFSCCQRQSRRKDFNKAQPRFEPTTSVSATLLADMFSPYRWAKASESTDIGWVHRHRLGHLQCAHSSRTVVHGLEDENKCCACNCTIWRNCHPSLVTVSQYKHCRRDQGHFLLLAFSVFLSFFFFFLFIATCLRS